MGQKYDLETRTLDFASRIFGIVKTIKRDPDIALVISQLIRSATSIGANYREATGASSKRDFRNKITICRKEAKEAHYWLELLGTVSEGALCELTQEAEELVKIFSKIVETTDKNILESKS